MDKERNIKEIYRECGVVLDKLVILSEQIFGVHEKELLALAKVQANPTGDYGSYETAIPKLYLTKNGLIIETRYNEYASKADRIPDATTETVIETEAGYPTAFKFDMTEWDLLRLKKTFENLSLRKNLEKST